MNEQFLTLAFRSAALGAATLDCRTLDTVEVASA